MLGFNSTVYDWLKLAHILAAITWAGGGIFVQLYATRLDRQNDPVRLAGFAKDIEWFGLRVFTSSSLLVLATGITLVIYTPGLNFTDTWILLALIGFGYTFVTGAFFLGPESGRLGTLFRERSPDDPEIQRRIKRIFLVSRVDLLVILLVVVDMVLKPGR